MPLLDTFGWFVTDGDLSSMNENAGPSCPVLGVSDRLFRLVYSPE